MKELLINARRHIHNNPELGFETYNTAKYIYNILTSLGFKPIYALNNAAVLCKIDLNKENTIAFRADIDALNIKENNDLEYKSSNNYMHACGHDGHAAILLGLAKLIKDNINIINTNILLIFQPAEEGPLPGGAYYLKEHQLLKDIKAFFAFHVTQKLYNDQIGFKYEAATASPDLWELEINGIGCHACTPSLGINPIIVGSKIVLELEKLYHNILKEENIVITTTYFNSGVSMNIICDKAILKGTARSFREEIRKKLHHDMDNVIKNVCNKYNASYKFSFLYAYPSVYNDPKLGDLVIKSSKNLYEDKNIIIYDKPELIGEDFAYYREIAPISFIWLGVRDYNKPFYDLHNPDFLVNEDALIKGANLFFEIIKNYN